MRRITLAALALVAVAVVAVVAVVRGPGPDDAPRRESSRGAVSRPRTPPATSRTSTSSEVRTGPTRSRRSWGTSTRSRIRRRGRCGSTSRQRPAKYVLHFDRTGDGRADVSYEFRFTNTAASRSETLPLELHRRRLPALQRLARVVGGREHEHRVSNLPVAPRTSARARGARSRGAARATRRSAPPRCATSGGTAASSPVHADDPFFGDIGAAFDALGFRNGTGNMGGGKDTFAGFNVSHDRDPDPDLGESRAEAATYNSGGGLPPDPSDRRPFFRPRVSVSRTWFQVCGWQPAPERGRDPDREEGPLEPSAPRGDTQFDALTWSPGVAAAERTRSTR